MADREGGGATVAMADGEAAAEAMAMEKPVLHVLLLSFPVASHLNPLLQLARTLSHSSPSFLFTSIVSLHNASRTQQQQHHLLPQSPRFELRTIALPDGLPLSHPRSLFPDLLQASRGLRPALDRLLPQLQLSHPPVSCILADAFLPWSQDVANTLGVPRFVFFTSNATSCCVMSQAPDMISKGVMPFKDPKQRISCPGAPALLPSEFPPSMQTQDLSFYRLKFALEVYESFEEAAGLVFNTFYELESKAIDALHLKCPVYTVGPLLLQAGLDGTLPIQQEVSFWQVEDGCLPWLDTQSPSSVLYVSFGSLSTFSDAQQMQELALGLEASQQPFLWVIREDAIHGSLSEVLPEGFLDRNRDRSLIISWAPQLLVLKHPAVGGFLSHCGWNSTLENIVLAGIPMLCLPGDDAEQKVNARVLVDDWKLGLDFERRDDGKVDRGEVERGVRALMQGEDGKEMRKRAAELKSEAGKAVKEGGSSFKNVEALVKNMRERVQLAAD